MTFDSFVWKVASRCNLNCHYCYVYNIGDESWRSQPKMMSAEVATAAAKRIRDHALRHELDRVVINFHGGEPLLGGTRHIGMLHSIISDTFSGTGVVVDTAMQTNGLLFDSGIGDFLLERDIALYVSVDGPPEINDKNRPDVRGKPTGAAVTKKLAQICSAPYNRIFAGFLSVVDPVSEPRVVVDYLVSRRPPMIDFLLPLNNHEKPPRAGIAAYGDWLCAAFDYVMDLDVPVRVRTFDDIMLRLLGHGSDSHSDYLVVETDGTLELDDTLKTAFDGASKLGYDMATHDLDEVMSDPRVPPMRDELAQLCDTCQACRLVQACRGGHVSHRYSESRGLDNPSVYCSALEQLVFHIRRRLMEELDTSRMTATG